MSDPEKTTIVATEFSYLLDCWQYALSDGNVVKGSMPGVPRQAMTFSRAPIAPRRRWKVSDTLLDRMQKEAETWSCEEPKRALWVEAAAEIRRLRAENERLREALRDIARKLQDAKHGRINRRWDDWIFTIEVALTPEARDGE